MALAGPAPETPFEPQVERVPSGRRAAIVVALAAILVVGTLVWKPWDGGAPAATRAPTFPAIALASATPIVPPSDVLPAATPVPTIPMNAPDNLGNVALTTDSGPFVQCVYGRPVGQQRPLRSMHVAAPIVTTYFGITDAHVSQVEFHAELEANVLQGLFIEVWQYVDATRVQRREVTENGAVPFSAIRVPVAGTGAPRSGIYRVVIVVDWVGLERSPVAALRLYPNSYAPSDVPSATAEPDGCPVWITVATTN